MKYCMIVGEYFGATTPLRYRVYVSLEEAQIECQWINENRISDKPYYIKEVEVY